MLQPPSSSPPRPGAKPATLIDVAREAGVGLAAVSGILNNTRSGTRVSPATRERVLRVAAELRYTPNKMARGLKSVRLNTIGVSFQTIGHNIIRSPYSSTLLQGVIDVAYPRGFNVVIVCKPEQDSAQSVDDFRNQGIDGFLIVAPYPTSDMVAGLKELGVPQVVVSSAAAEHSAVPSVDIDNETGARLAMDHLLSLGHRRIAHMTDTAELADTARRRDIYRATMARAGLPIPPEYLVYGDYRKLTFYADACRLLTLPQPPTAIFASGGDLIALEVLRAAHDLRIPVPERLSVVGFDDFPMTAYSNPPLTTVHQPLLEMGIKATQLLLALLSGEMVPTKTHWFPPALILRNSTAPPP